MIKIQVPFDEPMELTRKSAFDDRSQWTSFGDPKVKGEIIQPTFILKNSYDGSTGIQCYIGWVRMICSNGLVSMDGLQMRSIHTKHQVSGFIDQVAKMDYQGQYESLRDLFSKRLSSVDLKKIQESLPAKYRKEMTEYMKLSEKSDYLESNSAYAALNFITYLQSNVYALSRGGQLNKAIKNVYKMAA